MTDMDKFLEDVRQWVEEHRAKGTHTLVIHDYLRGKDSLIASITLNSGGYSLPKPSPAPKAPDWPSTTPQSTRP